MKQKESLVFCTYPSFYSSLVLQKLLLSPDIEILAVISSTRNLRVGENSLVSTLRRLAKSGLHYSVYLWSVTQGHSLFSQWSRVPSVQALAKQYNIPTHETDNINNNEMKRLIAKLGPDFLLCAHFNQRIKPEVYSLVKKSALNLHPSLLPDLKGVDPSFYALLHEYEESGVSLHKLAEEFDAGDVILNEACQIKDRESLFSLNCQLFLYGGDLFLTYLKDRRKIVTPTMKATRESYASWPSSSEVKAFRRGRKMLSLENLKWVFSKL